MINLKKYIDKISILNYAIAKYDVPYNPKEFPDKYAIGKDLDIYVCIKHYNDIKNVTKKYFSNYERIYNIKIIEKKNNYRLRMEKNNKLHFQIDITSNSIMINDRQKIKNFYVLSKKNEIYVRKKEIVKNPHKIHHKKWLIKNNIL